ncbi:hypothetical protein [Saccharopolyspora endophytica]|uniref:DNA primase n=1 Tax=Saccharopolyspora endophytica TaxID=543886 RepID=A0ABS5DQ49_9PSEU|nr:hypothetical protein [Saccharopolyspora endophytica]MBQ0928420.1 hypothetical protein [Saccharopolyspora endophytica]
MKQGPQMATAVALGYALGRSRRMKLALMVGGVVLGRRMGDPKELLAKAGGAVDPSGEVGGALRDRLVEAARTAAIAAASNEIESMSDNLSERAAKLRSPQSDSSESSESEEDEQESASSEEPKAPQQRSSTEDDQESTSSKSEDEQESASSETEDDQVSESNQRTRAPRKPSAPRAATPRKKTSAASSSGSNRRSGGNDG